MASTYSTDLKLELMATGENAGTWGTKTNTNLNLVQQAIAGFESVNVTSTTISLTMSNGAISQARNAVLNFAGTLGGATNITIPDGIEKVYLIKDATTHSGNDLSFKTVSGTGIALTEGKTHIAYSDGTNMNEINLGNLAGEIGNASIADNSITTAKISDNQITTAKISANQITTSLISDNQITTSKIDNDAVTAAKLERKFTISTSSPSGGNDGDIWLQYS